MKVVGIQRVDYVSRKTGNKVEGLHFHVVHDENPENDRLIGQRVEIIFISARSAVYPKAQLLQVGSDVRIFYNSSGFVEEVVDLSAKK